MLTCKTPWRSLRQLNETRQIIKKFYKYCSHSASHYLFILLLFFKLLKKLLKNYWKKINNVWVRAIPVSGEIQEWLQSLIVRLNWLNESSQQMTFSSPEYRWTTSLNKKGCLLFATLVTISCLTNRCFHSHWYFIVPLWDTLLTIPTSKELRYNLLTFAIFIIQSQVGVIPVFSRLCGFSHRVVEIS